MKILITVATYYPDVDGVQSVTEYQAEGLEKLGNEVTVVSSSNRGKYNKEEWYNNVHIIRVDAYNNYMMHFGDRRSYQQLIIRLANSSDVMINVCPESFSVDWILPIVNKIKCKKYIMNHGMHDFKWYGYNLSSPNEFAKKILRDIRWKLFYIQNLKYFEYYDGMFFLHKKDNAMRFFENKGFRNCFELNNCADDIFFLNNDKKNNQIINVGTFNSRKNQKECLKVFYCSNTKDWTLVLIGNPENKYYYELLDLKRKFDKKYGFRKVKILCNVDRNTTIYYIKSSKIYLLCSTWEAFPISVIEAMASGSAFVSSDVGILKYLLGGVIGKTEKQLILSLNHMLIEYEKYSDLASQYAKKHFDKSLQVKRMESLL